MRAWTLRLVLAMSALTTACNKDVPPEKVKPLAAEAPRNPVRERSGRQVRGSTRIACAPTEGEADTIRKKQWYADVTAAMEGHLAFLVACFDGTPQSGWETRSSLMIHFAVDRDARAQHVGEITPFDACLEAVLETTTFPAPTYQVSNVSCKITSSR